MDLDPRRVPLLGPPTASLDHARAYARRRGAKRPDQVDAFAAELWRLGTLAGYDPAAVFAQFCDETGVGTAEAWATRLNPGGLGITDDRDQMIGFAGGVEAARAMLTHLSTYVRGYDHHFWPFIGLDPRYLEPLKRGWGGTVRTLADLGGGKWATNPNYATQIAAHLAAIRAGRPAPIPPPTLDATPPAGIVWVGTDHWHERTDGQPPVAIVYHVTDDLVFDHVRGWFQHPDSRASAHFVIDRDGTIYQFVSTTKAAWTNGDFAGWRRDIPWLTAAVARCHHLTANPNGRMNLNDFTVNLEFIGKPGLAFTEPQVRRAIELTRYLLARYPTIPPIRGHLLRHADINAVDRAYCPGPTFPLARIIEAVGGDPERLG